MKNKFTLYEMTWTNIKTYTWTLLLCVVGILRVWPVKWAAGENGASKYIVILSITELKCRPYFL